MSFMVFGGVDLSLLSELHSETVADGGFLVEGMFILADELVMLCCAVGVVAHCGCQSCW